MPADFEKFEEVGAQLRQLENEAEGVTWASADAVRLRGRARAHRRAVAGTTVVCLGIATLGVSITGNLPGQEGFLNTTVPIAGVPTEQRTVPGNPGDDESSDGTTGTGDTVDPDDPSSHGTGPDSPEGTDSPSADPTDESATPTDEASTPTDDTSPTSSDSASPDPTDSSSPTFPPLSLSAVPVAAEFPTFADLEGSWAESGSGSGEGRASSTWRCDKPALADLGAVGSAWRTHDWTPESGQETDEEPTKVSGAGSSASFSSVDEAADGYGDLVAAVEACSWGSAGSANSVSLSSGTAAWWQVSGEKETHVVGLVQRGAAVAYVVVDQPTTDAAASMDATLRAAADRLADWDR